MVKTEKKAEDFVSKLLVDYKVQKLEDVQRFNSRRKDVMRLIANSSISRLTLLVHISTELQLLEFSKQRLNTTKKPIEENLKKNLIEILTNRVNEMYSTLFLIFSPTIDILKKYTMFCSENGLLDECSMAMRIVLLNSQYDVGLYIHASEFEIKCNKNIEVARLFLEEGIQVHSHLRPNLKHLHINRFMMEIENYDKRSDYIECFKCFQDTVNVFKDVNIDFLWEFFFCSLRYPNVEKLQSAISDEIVKIYKSHDKLWYTVQQDKNIMEIFDREVGVLIKRDLLPMWEVMIKCLQGIDRPDLILSMHSKAAGSRGNIARLCRPKFVELYYYKNGLIKARKLFNKLKELKPLTVELYQTILRFEVNSNIIQVKNPTRPERIIERVKQLELVRSIYSEACRIFGETNTSIWMDYIRFENDFGDKQNVNNVYAESKNHLSLEHIPTMESEFEDFKTNVKDVKNKTQVVVIQIDD